MSRWVFKRDDSATPAKGTWSPTKTTEGPSAIIVCPMCGVSGALNHAILPNGDVNPSLVCPTTGCTFHEYGMLEGWSEPFLPGGQTGVFPLPPAMV